ncbi:MAG: hypothetical protein K2R98_31895 [Gemmataceae bacterium]|nr:hypothetical protein [Gemmataceae bacterium]
MQSRECTISVKRLPGGGFHASCPTWPDCEATAATEEAARQAVEQAIDQLTRRQAANSAKEPHEPD